MRYPISLLTYLALAAIPASASRPLYTQYIAPFTNQTWDARVVTGEEYTGRGLDFNHVLESDGLYHNYVMEIDGRIYGAWRRWWNILGGIYPDIMTRSLLTQGSPEKRYLYQLNYEKNGDSYAFISMASEETLESYSGSQINDEFIVWLSINGNDGKYKFDTEVKPNKEPKFVQLVHTDWEYVVKFDANGGTGIMSSQTYTNSADLVANSFTREGYTFDGWYSGSTTYKDKAKVSDSDLTLYAQWKPIRYTVTVLKTGGEGNVTGGGLYEYGSNATISATPSKGHHFDRWEDSLGTEVSTESSFSFNVTGAVTNTAVFAPNTYTLKYDKNGGEGPDFEPVSVSYTGTIVLWNDENLCRKGYTLSGWSLTPNGSTTYQVSSEKDVKDLVSNPQLDDGDDLTLYAVWQPKSFKVTFDDGGETYNHWILYNQKYYGLTNALPTKTGYAFEGYYLGQGDGVCYFDDGGIPQLEWNIAEDTTLYARWKPIEYIVKFDTNADDASGSMDTMTLTYDVPTNLTGNAFSRDKWLFDGWTNFEAQVRYEDGAVVSNLTAQADSSVKLHALWRRDTFNLALHNGDATSSLFVTNGFEYGSLPIPTNSSLAEFAGWWTSDDLNEARQVLDGDFVNRSTTTNLYARWKPIFEHQTCTVSFSADGAKSKPDSETRTVGKEIGELPTVSYEGGYELLGWYLNGKRVTSETIVPSNVTLVARKTLKAFNDAWGCYDIAFSTNGVTGWTIDGSTKIAQSREASPNAYPKSALVFMADTDGDLSFDWLADCCPPSLHIPAPAYLQFIESGRITDYITASTEFISKSGISIICGEIYSFEYRRETKNKVGGDCGRVKNFVWCPVSASSVVDGWASLTSITSAVPEATFASGGNASWQTVGGDVVAVTNLEDNGTAWLELSLPGPGELRFDWHVSSEPGFVDTNGVKKICDYLEFLVDSTRDCEIHGLDMADYSSVVFTNNQSGVHKYRWRYAKDDSAKAGEDSAYLKNLRWTSFTPDTTEVEYDDPHGGDKKVVLSVPNSWVDKYSLLSAAKVESYDAALMANSGKKGPGGADLPYWYDYVAGTDPTNSASLFKIKSVSVVDDTVNIEWDPDWSDANGEMQRVYTIWGKTNLTDAAWHTPTNSASRFFKVEVSLPE